MEKITNVLYSLIPLILIILFSWLFSMMGSKARKQAEGKSPAAKEGTGSPFLDMLLNPKEEEEEIRPVTQGQGQQVARPVAPLEPGAWAPQNISGPTQISSEPITPKWWGA